MSNKTASSKKTLEKETLHWQIYIWEARYVDILILINNVQQWVKKADFVIHWIALVKCACWEKGWIKSIPREHIHLMIMILAVSITMNILFSKMLSGEKYIHRLSGDWTI